LRAAYKIKKTMEQILQSAKDGTSENERVHSLFAVDIVSMTHAHIIYVLFKIFRGSVEDPATFKCPNLRGHMLDLVRIMALHELTTQDSSSNYEAGYFAMGTAPILLEAQKKLLSKIRPQMISLIEGWQFPDSMLVSAIGNSYGDIYE
jgi:hypothetical protein